MRYKWNINKICFSIISGLLNVLEDRDKFVIWYRDMQIIMPYQVAPSMIIILAAASTEI